MHHHDPSEMTRDQRSTPSTYVKFQTEKERLDNLAFASFPEDYLPYTSSYHRKAPYLVWDDDTQQHRKCKRKRSRACSSLTNRCRCCNTAALVTAIVLIVTGILAVVAVSVYLGVLTSFFVSPVFSVSGRLRVVDGDDFVPSLLDVNSEDFKTKAASYEAMLHRVYEASALQQALETVKVFAFREGSLNVFFRLHLDRRKVVLPEKEVQQLAKDILEKEALKDHSMLFSELRIDPQSLDLKAGVEDSDWLLLKLAEDLQSTVATSTLPSTTSVTPTTVPFLEDHNETTYPSDSSQPPSTDETWISLEVEGNDTIPTPLYDDSTWQGNESTSHHSSGNLIRFQYGPWTPYHSTQRPTTSDRIIISPGQSSGSFHPVPNHPSIEDGHSSNDASRLETFVTPSERFPDGTRRLNVTMSNILQYSPPETGSVKLRLYDIVTLPPNTDSAKQSSSSFDGSPTANNVNNSSEKGPDLPGVSINDGYTKSTEPLRPLVTNSSTEGDKRAFDERRHKQQFGHSHQIPPNVNGFVYNATKDGHNIVSAGSGQESVLNLTTSNKESRASVFDDEFSAPLDQANPPNLIPSTLNYSSPTKSVDDRLPMTSSSLKISNSSDELSTVFPLENKSSVASVNALNGEFTEELTHSVPSSTDASNLPESVSGDESDHTNSSSKFDGGASVEKHDGQSTKILVNDTKQSASTNQNVPLSSTQPSIPAIPKVVRVFSDTKSHENSIKTSQDSGEELDIAEGPFLIYKPINSQKEDDEDPKTTVASLPAEKDRNTTWTSPDRNEVHVPYRENSVSEDPVIDYWNVPVDTQFSSCEGFTCSNGQCVPEYARCNRKQECRDSSDEENCSCAAYLKALNQPQKVCDGVLDCHDYSDEKQCSWCSADQVPCFGEKKCINSSQLCDGTYDCLFGNDERYCVRLANDADSANRHTYHSEGFLMVHREGTWGKLCLENLENLADSNELQWKMEELGKAVCTALSYRELTDVQRTTDPQSSSSYFEISPAGNSRRRSITMFHLSECPSKDVVRVSCKSLECGMRPMSFGARRRVVGGESTLFGSWPWQVALYKEGEFQCGAVLINDQWLLSAGHCFHLTRTAHWTARLGMLRRGVELPSPFEIVRKVKHIVIHPDYVDKGFINDIAVLKLEEKVPFSDFLRPVCLPEQGEDGKQWAGELCSVVGWGKLYEQGHTFPDTLQEVRLPVIPTQECRKRTVFLPIYKITDNMFCAGYERGGRDACLGDSGGPLMCQRPNGRWVVIGVTSNGDGCGRPNRPGVYTKIANYLTWIDTVLKGDSGHPVETFCAGHRCHLGRCLSLDKICDGVMDCGDGSDEIGCSTSNTH